MDNVLLKFSSLVHCELISDYNIEAAAYNEILKSPIELEDRRLFMCVDWIVHTLLPIKIGTYALLPGPIVDRESASNAEKILLALIVSSLEPIIVEMMAACRYIQGVNSPSKSWARASRKEVLRRIEKIINASLISDVDVVYFIRELIIIT